MDKKTRQEILEAYPSEEAEYILKHTVYGKGEHAKRNHPSKK
jgi:hypothetical protein